MGLRFFTTFLFAAVISLTAQARQAASTAGAQAVSQASAPTQSSATAAVTAQQHMAQAQAYLRQQRPDLAVPELRAVVAQDPGNMDAQANLGVLLYFAHQDAEAVPHLQAALQSQPGLAKIQALLGLAEMRLHQTTEARHDLQQALPHLQGEKVQAQVGDALIDNYTADGELAKAADVVSELLRAEPTDARLLLLSYRLHTDLASSALLSLAIAAPQSAELHQAMGSELARHGDDAAAIRNFEAALAENPKLPGLHFELGNLYFDSTDTALQAKAEAQFAAALAVDPRDEKSELMLGKIASQHGNLQAALEHDRHALVLEPNDEDACAETAKVLLALKQPQQARPLLEQAVQLEPTDERAHYLLGTLDRQQGKVEDARRELEAYQKYKKMKATLRDTLHDLRLPASAGMGADDAPSR